MDKYKVVIHPKAIRELEGIYQYIAFDKLAPDNAKAQADRIKNEILALDTFPQAHQERIVGRYANRGYRQLLVDNYMAIYKIDEDKKTVRVVTVKYQGRNT